MSSRPSIDGTRNSPIGQRVLANVRAVMKNGIKDYCIPGFYMKDYRLKFQSLTFNNTEDAAQFFSEILTKMLSTDDIKQLDIQFEDRMESGAEVVEYDEEEQALINRWA